MTLLLLLPAAAAGDLVALQGDYITNMHFILEGKMELRAYDLGLLENCEVSGGGAFVCVCVSVCVCERERVCVCVCVCVSMW